VGTLSHTDTQRQAVVVIETKKENSIETKKKLQLSLLTGSTAGDETRGFGV
jgi:hypothetical protein